MACTDFVNFDRVLQVFRRHDSSGDGTIAQERMGRILCELDARFHDGSAERAFLQNFDARGDGNIDYVEFVSYVFAVDPAGSTLGAFDRTASSLENGAAARVQDWRASLCHGQSVLCWRQLQPRARWLQGVVSAFCLAASTVSVLCDDGEEATLQTSSPDLQPSMKDRGMSLAQLRRFAQDCRSESATVRDTREFFDRERTKPNPRHLEPLHFDSAPSWLVVDLFVKPVTRQRRVPFVDIMASRWPDLGGPGTTTHFMSHSWGQCFVEDLEAVKALGEDAYVWICCFAMTQDEERLELLDNSEIFKEALTAPTTIAQVLVLDHELQAVTRGWVLFEILRAHQSGKELQICPPGLIVESRLGTCAVELEKASCTVDADWQYILREFQREGLDQVNGTVRAALLRSFRREFATIQRARGDIHLDSINAAKNFASLLKHQGHFEEAAAILQRTFQTCRDVSDTSHPNTLNIANDLAGLYHSLGRLSDAEPLQRLVVRGRLELLGPSHIDSLSSLFNLAVLLSDRGKHAEAEDMKRTVLRDFEESLGPSDPLVMSAMGSLAATLMNMQKHREAESLFRRVLARRDADLGPRHPDTLCTVNNLAGLLQAMGNNTEAEPLFRRVLEGREIVLGAEHPETAGARTNLALVLYALERLVEAEPLLREAQRGLERTLGRDHVNTLCVQSNLAELLAKLDEHEEAETLSWQALQGLEAALGPNHPHAFTARGVRGRVLQRMCGAIGSSAPDATVKPGHAAYIHNLAASAALNNQEVMCEHWDSVKGRWYVRCQDGRMRAVKPANLLRPGVAVCLHGLVGAPELNGLQGTCERWDPSKCRWVVRLGSGAQKAFKPDNLARHGLVDESV